MKKILSNAVTVFVLVIVLLLIIPLSPFLMDILIIINIAVSMVVLIISMNIREPLELSTFPSLLLVTTLFRLGLNVSSTRNILTNQGQSGQVIQAFGTFVLRGNVVVGFVIFFIIVLVQFIVITKGAERVAEVAARFTLDAMPGKQMAIDADLSAGLITEGEAKARRSKIQRESDFYGAMDGATKIVKGDSIMSIIITFVNLIGGFIIGIVQANKANTAYQRGDFSIGDSANSTARLMTIIAFVFAAIGLFGSIWIFRSSDFMENYQNMIRSMANV